jgi:hypothetical protein
VPQASLNFLLTFSDIYDSLECHKKLKRAGIPADIDNVPAHLGLNCGYAIRVEAADAQAIDTMMQENGVTCSQIIVMRASPKTRSVSGEVSEKAV